jgi:ubiquinone/menaquinone biosynthesis C-methylase UbiE
MTYASNQGIYTDPLLYDRRDESPMHGYMLALWRPFMHGLINRYVNHPPGLTVCDLGCGTLDYSRYFIKPQIVYAVDNNPEMIAAGKKKLSRQKSVFKYIVADSLQTGIPSRSCDLVWCIGLTEFVDINKLWEEISRICKKHSQVIISFPNPYNLIVQEEHLFQRFIRRSFVKNIYPYQQIRRSAGKFGFTVFEYNNLAALFWVPGFMEKMFVPVWKFLDIINKQIRNFLPLGAYSYAVFRRDR